MGAYDVIKDAVSLAQKVDNTDLMRKLLDLQQELLDIQEQNFRYKKQIEELQAIIEKTKRIEYTKERSSVYEILEDGTKEGPYCTHCWETNKKTVSLLKSHGSHYECPHCKASVKLYFLSNGINIDIESE